MNWKQKILTVLMLVLFLAIGWLHLGVYNPSAVQTMSPTIGPIE